MSTIFKVIITLLFIIGFVSCNKDNVEFNLIEIESGTEHDLRGVLFLNETVGFVVGGTNYQKGVILKTTDGAKTWSSQNSKVGSVLNDIYFLNLDTGIAVGDNRTIIYTQDGGSSWYKADMVLSEEGDDDAGLDFQGIDFVNENQGFIVGGTGYENGIILKTENGGLNWEDISSGIVPENKTYGRNEELLNNELTSIQFLDDKTGYIVGYGIILKTIDKGATWKYEQVDVGGFYRDVHFTDKNIGFIPGYLGVVIKKENSSSDWQNGICDCISKSELLESVAFKNSSEGLIVGDGIIIRTDNSGKTWSAQKKLSYSFKSVYYKVNGNAIVVGKEGTIVEITGIE